MRFLSIIFLFCSLLLVGCSDYIYYSCSDEIHQSIDTAIVSKSHPSIVNMVKRAMQIALIEWTPINPIPNRSGSYPAGISQRGIPYSSVKEKDKFIGQEVSFHTFMTAVHNPYSVLYSERVNQPPYNGVNCGAYYGTVCSMAVNYALGIELPYESSMYACLPCFAHVKPNSPSAICEGDILVSPGHVVLVIDIQRDKDDIREITILESAGSTFILKYNYNDFRSRWNEDNWTALRYLNIKDISYQSLPFVSVGNESSTEYKYNEDICTSRGDKVCYCEGETVVINILSKKYKTLELYKDDDLIESVNVNGINKHAFSKLDPGLYKTRLSNQTTTSEYTYFEILDINVNINKSRGGHIVNFSSINSEPEYLVICNITGARSAIEILSDEDILSKQKIIRKLKDGEYVKVFFRGKYGRVSNNPIKI